MPVLVLAIVGLIGIVAGIVSSRIAKKRRTEFPNGRFAKWFNVSMWLGLGLAVASWPLTGLMGYPYPDDLGRPGRVVGIPFIAAYFDHLAADFVGPLTLPAILANCLFWFHFPRVVVVAISSACQRVRKLTL
ncbi:MAG: hypothetical protein HOW73_22675 [Polyangiaceae bacterium]|nr:hypothetical protein [Polyangiaceae bacterium]